MDTLIREARQCAICTNVTTYTCVHPRVPEGDLDLDHRPYALSIVALPYWVQQCGTCRYCAADVRLAPATARDVVKSTAYLAFLNDVGYPFLAREYLAAAHICRMTTQYAAAGWHALRAAWKCEDMSHPMAGYCRTQATEAFSMALQHGDAATPAPYEVALILADLQRRSGDAAQALAHAADAETAAGTDAQRQWVTQLRSAVATGTRTRLARALTR